MKNAESRGAYQQSTCKVETVRSGVQRHPQQHVPGQVKLNLSIKRNKKSWSFFIY